MARGGHLPEHQKAAVLSAIDAEIARRGLLPPLWGVEYRSRDAETAWAFVRLCRTFDEASACYREFPDEPYLKDICRLWVETAVSGEPLIIEKSRRLVVSWLLRALELWDAGLRGQVQTTICGVDYDSSTEHCYRIYSLYEDLRRRKGTEWKWMKAAVAYGQTSRYRADSVSLPNGSLFETANEDSGGLRGQGKARVVLEEGPSYRDTGATYSQARIVTEPPPGQVHGHVVLVGNASYSDSWKDLKALAVVEEEVRNPLARSSETGELTRETAAFRVPWLVGRTVTGCRYVRAHYAVSEAKREPGWREKAKVGITALEWQREYELDDTLPDGDPVTPDFDIEIHAPSVWREDVPELSLRDTTSRFVLGGDTGVASITPALVLCRVTSRGQVQAVREWTPESPMTVTEIYSWAMSDLGLLVDRLECPSDATCATRSGASLESPRDSVRRLLRLKLLPVSNSLHERLEALRWLLTDWVDEETPRFVISEAGCPNLYKALNGDYQWRKVRKGAGGWVHAEPLKNWFSNVADALQYAAIFVRKELNEHTKFASPLGPTSGSAPIQLFGSGGQSSTDPSQRLAARRRSLL